MERVQRLSSYKICICRHTHKTSVRCVRIARNSTAVCKAIWYILRVVGSGGESQHPGSLVLSSRKDNKSQK